MWIDGKQFMIKYRGTCFEDWRMRMEDYGSNIQILGFRNRYQGSLIEVQGLKIGYWRSTIKDQILRIYNWGLQTILGIRLNMWGKCISIRPTMLNIGEGVGMQKKVGGVFPKIRYILGASASLWESCML